MGKGKGWILGFCLQGKKHVWLIDVCTVDFVLYENNKGKNIYQRRSNYYFAVYFELVHRLLACSYKILMPLVVLLYLFCERSYNLSSIHY